MEFYGDSFDSSDPEMLVNYEDDQWTEEDYEYEDLITKNGPVFSSYSFSFDEMLENCIIPHVKDGLAYIGPMIFWSIVFRILTQCCK